MKRLLLPLLAVAAFAIAVAAAWFSLDRSLAGRGGDTTSETHSLPSFSKVVIDGAAEVTLIQGAADNIGVELSGRQAPRVDVEVADDTLTIAIHDHRRWWSWPLSGSGRPPKMTISFRQLTSIRASGAVKITTDSLRTDSFAIGVSGAASLHLDGLEVKQLTLTGSGAMKAEISGHAVTQKIAISGAGYYRAADLQSDEASVAVSGAGRVIVNASKTLQVGISGAGLVEYLGNPALTQRVSGAGRVRRRDAAIETGHWVA
jgi:Putative auto-transporter adhesin, head GIN domain